MHDDNVVQVMMRGNLNRSTAETSKRPQKRCSVACAFIVMTLKRSAVRDNVGTIVYSVIRRLPDVAVHRY